jgi:predicted transcriptional regulator
MMNALTFSGSTDSWVASRRIRAISLARRKALRTIRKETRNLGEKERWGREREEV